MEELSDMTEGLQEFAKRYDMSLNDPLLNDMYEYELSAKRDYASAMSQAKNEGIEEGYKEAEVDMIRSMYENGIPADVICRTAHLPHSEIDAILAQQ